MNNDNLGIEYEAETLNINGILWRHSEDKVFENSNIYTNHTLNNWPQHLFQKNDKSEYDIFTAAFPTRCFDEIMSNENKFLLENKWRTTSKKELFQYFGIRGVMMLDPIKGGYPAYWKDNVDEPSVIMPRCYEARFGMSYTRFRQLGYCFKMAWSPSRKGTVGNVNPVDGHVIIDEDEKEEADPFFQVRSFITKFNNHMKRLITPGQGLIMDETMIPLNGMTLRERKDGMPAKVCMARKPEGTGLEIKILPVDKQEL